MSPDIARGPLGPQIELVENDCFRVLFFKLEMPWKENVRYFQNLFIPI